MQAEASTPAGASQLGGEGPEALLSWGDAGKASGCGSALVFRTNLHHSFFSVGDVFFCL